MRLSKTASAEEPSLLTLEERLAVVNLYEELGSYRAVAAIVGCDHKTVKAHVERGRHGAVVPRVVRRRATDPYRQLIRERVGADPGPRPRSAPAEGVASCRLRGLAAHAAADAARGEASLAAGAAARVPALAVGAGRLPHRRLG